ncbi:phage portal protein [Martelella alba]|uniref:Phage portal protein n=1 Tax=Martelella alba TaxID=2590451 RepID=A0A506U6B5_9HYPH|nr:phage portal protein [Martelella alba]TPW28641.1 phage portal protein [Martelella alba]
MQKALSLVGLARKSDSVRWTDERGQRGSVGDAGEVVTPDNALGLSAVWACANLVSGTISSLPFEVYRKGSDGYAAVAGDHPLHGVIHENPNYDQTALDFWDYLGLSIELRGNGFAAVKRSGGRVTALEPIHPGAMHVRRLASGALEYRWNDESGKGHTGTDRDVLHIRGPGGNPLGGMSTLQFGHNAFSAALAAERAAGGMFRNGLRPSGVFTFEDWLTQEQRTVAEEKLIEKYVGAMNAGRPIILEGGTKYQNLSISPEDAQMLETRQFSIEEICRFFQVPPVLIGHAGSATAWPTSVEQQIIMFQTFYLRKRLKRIEQAVTKQLLTAEDRAQGYSARFNMEGLLRGDSAARSGFYQTMTNIGAMTINEVRARENMRAIAGGDVPRMQMQNVPITETGKDAGNGN